MPIRVAKIVLCRLADAPERDAQQEAERDADRESRERRAKVCSAFGQITSQCEKNIGPIAHGRGMTNFETLNASQISSQVSSKTSPKAIGLTTVRRVWRESDWHHAPPPP